MSKSEELVSLFFRLNGYFLVENFIIHSGNENINYSKSNKVPQLTETDLLGIRLPFQKEFVGILNISNFENLVLNSDLIDLVIVESKTGNTNKPNSTWKNQDKIANIEYIIRFFGITNDPETISKISRILIKAYKVEWNNYSIRYIIVSENINPDYAKKGITYITINYVLDFIINIRGACWNKLNLGIASQHQQWSPFMKEIFKIANNLECPDEKKILIREFISN